MNNDAQKIIVEGDISHLVKTAEELGSEIFHQLSTSQIRNVFGEVRRIEAIWPTYNEKWTKDEKRKAQQAYRQAVLLRPKLAYQARKERGRGIEVLKDVLDPCLDILQETNEDKMRKLYFGRFVDFFEAILAYHKAAGGN